MRRRAKPGRAKVKVRLPVARKTPKNETSGRRELEKRLAESLEREKAKDRALAEALDQQTATSDILRVISRSQTDVQPVFDAIVGSAVHLLRGHTGALTRVAGDQLELAALTSTDDAGDAAVRARFPQPLQSEEAATRAMRDRAPFNIADTQTDPGVTDTQRAAARARGFRSLVVVPLLHRDEAVGTIAVTRREPGGFTEEEIALLQTFADQAVIAIENVRLFTELEGRNRDLTATAEILRVISSSPTDVQPVFDTIVRSAVRLCNGLFGTLLRFDGELIHQVAQHNYSPEGLEELHRIFPTRPTRALGSGRAILDRTVDHIPDIEVDPESRLLTLSRAVGFRSGLSVPMLREGTPIGAIVVNRAEPGPFSDSEIELLKTFADQAVIAVENVRLFTELQASNRELTTALDQQTATSDILRVISRSQTNVQPVFDAIVASAVRLLGAYRGVLSRIEGDRIELAALCTDDADNAGLRALYPSSLESEGAHAQAIRDRAPLNVADARTDSRLPEAVRAYASDRGFRSAIVVPLLHHDEAVGAISLTRREPGGFTDDEMALLKTFADQAVIAIENVRLFTELEGRNRDLTATSEILRVISSSPTDVQPVFDTIVRSAVRLCDGLFSGLLKFDGELLHYVAHHNFTPEALEEVRRVFPARASRGYGAGRAIVERAVVHIPDVELDPEFRLPALYRTVGWRSGLFVPMLREGAPIGVIAVTRAEPGPFSGNEIELLKTFADQAVIAIENVRLFKELEVRNRDLSLALDRQTATSEVLRVIGSSPTDAQPVFDAIATSAVRLLDGFSGAVLRLVGDDVHLMAITSTSDSGDEAMKTRYPRPLADTPLSALVVRERAPCIVSDTEADPLADEAMRQVARARGFRSQLQVPMLRDGAPIGMIAVARREPGPFAAEEIALLQTFADQAVIAIENVRLFTELTEALEQETATAEILRAISGSPTDLRPVLETLVHAAARFCGAPNVSLVRLDGDVLRQVAATGPYAEDMARRVGSIEAVVVPVTRESVSGRAVIERRTIHIRDLAAEPESEFPVGRELQRALGHRTMVATPLLREGVPSGAICLFRTEVAPFSDKQIKLLQTFADQAVIAIENVRLFTELQASNRELTTALDTQTATSDILRVISQSQTNVQPVFDAIVASAVRLLGAYAGMLTRVAGDQIVLAAITSTDDAGDDALRAVFPRSLHFEGTHSKVIRDRAPVNIADAHTDPRLSEASRATHRTRGSRSQVVVPLLHHDEAVGTIAVSRREAGGFTDDEIALLKTFADQAVIAIENVRLFNELEGRNRDLTATSEILRVISSSPTDVQPVFDTIVRSAVRLCDGLFSGLYQFDGERLHHVAYHNYTPEALEEVHRIYPARPTRALGTGRAILERSVVLIPDFDIDPEYQHHALSRAIGARSLLCVPMLREGTPIGVIAVSRAERGPFSDSEIELLKTFADQAVIAVENVRLFKELQARTSQLTQSVEQLTALGEVSRAVSSTLDVETVLDTIVSRATQLAGADGCAISEYDDATELFHVRATHAIDAALVETLRTTPLRKGEGVAGRATEMREPIQIADIAVPGAYQSHLRDVLIRAGFRAVLSVPLLREEQIIGSLSLNRKAPGEFSPEVVEVLKTFATQSALAIQNARLFREIADKSAQLEAASRHKSEFLANMSHELRTPLNAIIGFSEVLVDRMFGELNEKQEEYLKDIYASGQHLLSLINDILDLSKIEAGRMELELADFDLPTAIDNALILVRERATRRGITLGRTIDEHLGTLRGDERKVKQVLLNLLSNALKFTPEGGRIDVSARLQNGAAEIAVADTGVGIAPEDQEAVFEEFRQVGTADKKVEGTGLGLALSRKFIELHGGRIWVTSQVGQGSTFTFTLPVRRGE